MCIGSGGIGIGIGSGVGMRPAQLRLDVFELLYSMQNGYSACLSQGVERWIRIAERCRVHLMEVLVDGVWL